jgi:hypothetical protein
VGSNSIPGSVGIERRNLAIPEIKCYCGHLSRQPSTVAKNSPERDRGTSEWLFLSLSPRSTGTFTSHKRPLVRTQNLVIVFRASFPRYAPHVLKTYQILPTFTPCASGGRHTVRALRMEFPCPRRPISFAHNTKKSVWDTICRVSRHFLSHALFHRESIPNHSPSSSNQCILSLFLFSTTLQIYKQQQVTMSASHPPPLGPRKAPPVASRSSEQPSFRSVSRATLYIRPRRQHTHTASRVDHVYPGATRNRSELFGTSNRRVGTMLGPGTTRRNILLQYSNVLLALVLTLNCFSFYFVTDSRHYRGQKEPL